MCDALLAALTRLAQMRGLEPPALILARQRDKDRTRWWLGHDR